MFLHTRPGTVALADTVEAGGSGIPFISILHAHSSGFCPTYNSAPYRRRKPCLVHPSDNPTDMGGPTNPLDLGPSTPILTVQQLQEQLAHIHDDRAPGMLAAAISFMVLTVIVTSLRLSSRRIQGLRLGADDYLVISSLVRNTSMILTCAASY